MGSQHSTRKARPIVRWPKVPIEGRDAIWAMFARGFAITKTVCITESQGGFGATENALGGNGRPGGRYRQPRISRASRATPSSIRSGEDSE